MTVFPSYAQHSVPWTLRFLSLMLDELGAEAGDEEETARVGEAAAAAEGSAVGSNIPGESYVFFGCDLFF